MSDVKRMSAAEFRALGYLQEVNRLFLHPCGLALEVIADDEGNVTGFGGVWDYRDDAEGIYFAEPIDVEQAAVVRGERERHRKAREALFGSASDVQPFGRPRT